MTNPRRTVEQSTRKGWKEVREYLKIVEALPADDCDPLQMIQRRNVIKHFRALDREYSAFLEDLPKLRWGEVLDRNKRIMQMLKHGLAAQ